jgi:response regulator RpfG family c-di-GMP phosphodiesterase
MDSRIEEGARELNRAVRERYRDSETRDRAARIAVYSVSVAYQLGCDEEEQLRVRALAETLPDLEETWNGMGPQGSVGSRIPLPDRIVAMATWFDDQAMNGHRLETEVLNELHLLGGSRFDPLVVAAFQTVQPLLQPTGINVG